MRSRLSLYRFLSRAVGFVLLAAWLSTDHAHAQVPTAGTDDGGLQKGRAYFSPEPFEHFDVQTGNLVFEFTDLELIGNAGHTLRLVRYGGNPGNSPAWTLSPRVQSLALAGYAMSVHEGWGFPGPGTIINWEWGVEWFLEGAPKIAFSDGAVKQTFFMNTPDTSSTETILETMQWVSTADLIRYNRLSHMLYFPDGRQCHYGTTYFSQDIRYLTWCADQFGNLIFELERSGNTMTIVQHVGTHEREVVLNYPSGLHWGLPNSMTYLGRTWTYTDANDTLTVTQPEGLTWLFTDTTITTPGGGLITYTFAPQSQSHPEGNQDHGVHLVSRTSRSGPGVEPTSWTITYNFAYNPGGPALGGEPPHRPITVYITTPPTPAFPEGVTTTYWGCGGNFANDPENGEYVVGNTATNCAGSAGDALPSQNIYAVTPLFSYPSPAGVTLKRPVRIRQEIKNCDSYPNTGCVNYVTKFWEDANQNVWKIEETNPDTAVKRTTTRTFFRLPFVPYINGLVESENVLVENDPQCAVDPPSCSVGRTWTRDGNSGFVLVENNSGLVTTFDPDDYGNVWRVIKNGHTTQFAYEWGQVTSTATPEYTVTRVISPEGTVASETQAGRTTEYEYDLLGRRTRTDGPDGTTPTITTYTPTEVVSTRGAARVKTVLDGFGRAIRTETGDTTSYAAKTVTKYDPEGRPIFQGLPVDINTQGDGPGTQTTYDSIGRIATETHTDGSARTYTYTRTSITVQDEEYRQTVITRQMFGDPRDGRITQLLDASGSTWTYRYNVLGSLTGVFGLGGVNRTWTYHPSSKLVTTEQHPESGTVNFTIYDASGVLKQKVDANGTVFDYAHDNNDRLTMIIATPASGPQQVTAFAYEAGSDRRASVSVDGVTTGFTYDAAGRLATRTDTVDGKSFTSQFGYDANDNLQTITYPSGRQVGYEYDTQNRLTRVFNAATQGTYANAFSYHPSGAVTGYTAGNGVATWLTYHPTRQWLDTIMVGQNADRTQLTYAYDDVGNISSIADWREGYSQTFGYDALDRLTSASGIYGSLTYTYDAHGNRQTANGGTYSYDPGNLFRLQSINGSYNLQYDANGNLRGGFPGQYDYTPDNLLSVSTISGGATTRFTYDSDAWRLKKSIDGGTTYYYVRGPNGQLLSEWVNSSPAAAVKDYLYAGGRLIGVATTTAAPK